MYHLVDYPLYQHSQNEPKTWVLFRDITKEQEDFYRFMLCKMRIYMNKTIFMGLAVAVLTAMLVVTYSGLLQDTKATVIFDPKTERRNNVLDKHIEAGGAHGERAQEIKDGGETGGGTGDSGGGGTGD